MKLPPAARLRKDDTHRLIRAKYADEGKSVLNRLTEDAGELNCLFELEGATNERLLGEAGLLPGISVHELVFGISHVPIVNAAFTHAQPSGSRFNLGDRGAWYAGFARETAEKEVAFHTFLELQEIDWREKESVVFADYLADFRGEFHDIRGSRQFANCLDRESYRNSQSLARELLQQGSAGIVYPSVRHAGGTCLACFRPALVMNVRKGVTLKFTFKSGNRIPIVSLETDE